MKRTLFIRTAMAVALLVGGAQGVTADPIAEATAAVWERHLAAGTTGNLDALVADFADDAAVVTAEGVVVGRDAIRAWFASLLGGFPQGAEDSVVVNAQQIHGEFVLFNFTVNDVAQTFNDTAVIRDGKIVVFSTVGYSASAGSD